MSKVNLLFLGIFNSLLFISCAKKVGKAAPAPIEVSANMCDSIKYSKHIKPIILNNCALSGCHSSGFSSGDFTNYSGLKLKIDNTTFKTRVFNSPTNPMPSSGMLPKGQLDSIKCWLDKGAPND
jgi:hypothetical protein